MNPTILVADDETHILNVVSIKLQNAGFTVITAEDGQEAYEKAIENHPDLIISDYQMPRLSGLELACRLAADESTRGIPILMLTARGYGIPDQERIHTNIRCVIPKPFAPRGLLAQVNELLAQNSGVAENRVRTHAFSSSFGKEGPD